MRIDHCSNSLSSPSTVAATCVASSRRRSRVASLLALAATLVPLAAASPALAFCRHMGSGSSASIPDDQNSGCTITTGNPTFWPSRYVGYRVSTGGLAEHGYDIAKVKAAIDQGFNIWNSATCADPSGAPSLHMTDLGTVTSTTIGYDSGGDNESLIVFSFDDPPPGKEEQIADTLVSSRVATGEILDVDIVVYAKNHKITVDGTSGDNTYDLATIMVHEAGHFIGLEHSPDKDATMYAGYSEDKHDLAADDVAGICAIYPPDGSRSTTAGVVKAIECGPGGPACPQEFVAGCSAAGAPGGSGAGFSLLTALGVAWAYRRRGRAAAPR